jgi:hypothetical protein
MNKAKLQDATVAAVIAVLAEMFPKCFSVYEGRRRPLKIGIHRDIGAALDGAVTPAELHRALGISARTQPTSATPARAPGGSISTASPLVLSPLRKRPTPRQRWPVSEQRKRPEQLQARLQPSPPSHNPPSGYRSPT